MPSLLDQLTFYCPIESAIHPDIEAIEDNSMAWLDTFEIYENPTQRAWLAGTNSVEFYARIVPTAAVERIQPAVNWCYWGFAFDDEHCDTGPTSSRTGSFVAKASRIVDVLETPGADNPTDPYEAAIADIANDFRRLATPTQFHRWVQAHRIWLLAAAQQVGTVESGKALTAADYLTMRLNSCAGEPTTEMIEMVTGLEVPDRELYSLPVIALTEATRLVAALDNDLVSYRKEAKFEAAGPNLVAILKRERQCPTPEAMDTVAAIRDRVMSLFLRLRDQILVGASQELRAHVDGLGHTIRGNIEWSLRVPRYNSLSNREKAPNSPTVVAVNWVDRPRDGATGPLPVPRLRWWWDCLG